ncbi:21 kDa protein-like [Aristolochia californica]|uniref:21 kDa protein-like n=1 Tax=Aristolochia californica TaxID=171875 RepID=UPI0035D85FB1
MGSRLLALLVCLLWFSFHLGSCSAALTSRTHLIKSKCGVTSSNPRVCIHRQEAHTALSVAATHVHHTARWMSRLFARQRMTKREKVAMGECMDLFAGSVRSLRAALREMRLVKGSDDRDILSDMNEWITESMNDHGTCIDGFTELNIEGELKDKVTSRLSVDDQLTDKALDLVVRFACDIHPDDPSSCP